MKLPPPIFSAKPDLINEEGTRWWKSESLTNHAEKQLGKNYRVYAVQTIDDHRAYLLLDDKNHIIADARGLEDMGFQIDKHQLMRRGY